MLFEPGRSNAIMVEPMRNRTSGEMLAAYLKLVGRLMEAGIEPKLHVLDNECSSEFKTAIRKNGMKFQLVPPNDHRRNVAEKSIQVFKDHFISVLCGTDISFPMRLWCRLLRQAEDQLNMLRTSRVDHTKSAFEVLHVMPNKRKTWSEHTNSGFYLGTSWNHYRCHEIWVSETSSVRVGQTVFFQHKYLT